MRHIPPFRRRGCYIGNDPFNESYNDSLSNGRPPAAPAIGGGSAMALNFPGIGKPSSDMQAVRDGRRSTLQGYLLDLSVAHTIAANNAFVLNIEGNVLMSDPLFDLSGNVLAGVVRIHFQDTNLNPVGTFVTALPNAIYKVPFTKVLIENYAQAGKFAWIVYGTDIDLLPGASQQVQATIVNSSLNVLEQGGPYAASFQSVTPVAAGANETVLLPAANTAGCRIWQSTMQSASASVELVTLLAKASAPASMVDGDKIYSVGALAGALTVQAQLSQRLVVGAGKGLYRRAQALETFADFGILYTL